MKNFKDKNCPFCQEFDFLGGEYYYNHLLSKFEQKSRIIFSDSMWNLIPTVGSFIPGYTLLVSKMHFSSFYLSTYEHKKSFSDIFQTIKEVYQAAYKSDVFLFEHGIVDESATSANSVDHLHLHIIPFKEKYLSINNILIENYNLPLYKLKSLDNLHDTIKNHSIRSYLLYYILGEYTLVDITNSMLPSQFLRKIIYQIERQSHDEGWNWKKHAYINNMLDTYSFLKPFFDNFSASKFSNRSENYEKESTWINCPDFIYPLIPKPFGNKFFLDIACGTGIICEAAVRHGWKVTATDCCQEMLDKVDNSVLKILSDAEDLPFSDLSFDLVVCRQGLQYMNKLKAIHEMVRISSKYIILLHATVSGEHISFWQEFFNYLGFFEKNIIETNEIQNIINNDFPNTIIESNKVLMTREHVSIPESVFSFISELLDKNPKIVELYNITVDKHSLLLSYNLEWQLITIKKKEEIS